LAFVLLTGNRQKIEGAVPWLELLWDKVAEIRNPSGRFGKDLPIPCKAKKTRSRVLESQLHLTVSVMHLIPCEPHFRGRPRITLGPPPDYGPEPKQANENNIEGSKASHNP
jgi:hypothetical protein